MKSRVVTMSFTRCRLPGCCLWRPDPLGAVDDHLGATFVELDRAGDADREAEVGLFGWGVEVPAAVDPDQDGEAAGIGGRSSPN